MLYRVKAWGAKDYPDLDYETADVPTDLGWKYPCYSVACLTAISATAFAAALPKMPEGPAGDHGQVGWMGGEFER